MVKRTRSSPTRATAGAQAPRREGGRELAHRRAAKRSQGLRAGAKLGAILDKIEKLKASVRAKVEHPFRVIKRQFGHTKVRYRGLAKNTAQLKTLFALSNLWMARLKLMALDDQIRPLTAKTA